ncbi:MAG: GGDEF domain-containing protein [Terriglobales bacterium]
MTARNGKAHKGISEKKTGGRAQEIQEHIGALGGRDLQLFSISLLLLLVLAAGILALIYPNLMTVPKTFQADMHLLPQLFFGLITLIILFNVYIVMQKRELSATRRRLVEELIFNERMEAVSLIDPTTQLFNRRAMEQMVAHEVSRTNRLGSALSLLILDISDFETISNRLGTAETEQFLYETAQLVRNTFRGSDMVFRYKETQFLVVMPDTAEQQVDFALKRLEGEIARHNSEFRCQAELAFSCGVAQFAQGSRITDTLLTAERKAFLQKHHFAQAF